MNQCVPSWELSEDSHSIKIKFHAPYSSSNSLLSDIPSGEYEITELKWENGQPAMHGLACACVFNKAIASSSLPGWDKQHTGGTLESLVNQATGQTQPNTPAGLISLNDLRPWFEQQRAVGTPEVTLPIPISITIPINPRDALVPHGISTFINANQEASALMQDGIGISMKQGCSTRVGSCSTAAPNFDSVGGPLMDINGCQTYGSMSETAACGGGESHQVKLDTFDGDMGGASLLSIENTFSGQECTKTSADDHDPIPRSKSEKKSGDEEGGKKKGKYTGPAKRSRAADIHNQSERKRRDRINERMKTLQKLVPNSSKTDKASMLDEVIDYLKQLQAHLHMISSMNPQPPPPPMQQQQLQMSMMGMGMGMSMGMGMGVMDMNSINRAAGLPPFMPPPPPFMHVPPAPWDIPVDCFQQQPPAGSAITDPVTAILACQPQPITIDAYNRLAAMYKQMQQLPVSHN